MTLHNVINGTHADFDFWFDGPRAVHTGYGHYTTASARIGTFYGPTLFS